MKDVLLRATSHLPKGMFWDIGAGDGRNTKFLADAGWGGIAVEAAPLAFSRLHAEYVGRPNVTLVNAAVGVEHRFVKFWDCAGETYGTTDPDCMEKWTRAGIKFAEYFVPLVTIGELVSSFSGAPNVISMTIGKLSFEVLRALPIKSWLPAAMVVEHAEQSTALAEWGRSRFYEVAYLDTEKIVLVHREWIGKVKR